MTGRPSVLGSGLAAGLAAVCVATGAQAGSGAVFGEASRTAALADAVTARPGELSAIFYNPGAFADLEQSQAAFGAHVGRLQLTYGRDGEPEHTDERTIAGFSLAVGARLPGPDWLRAFRVGIAAHVPAGHAVKLLAPSRPDEPYFPLYRGRVERTSITATLAAKLFSRIGVGVGVMLNPTLYSPTVARYEAWRSPDPDDNVMLSMDRELRLGAAAVAGLRAQVVDQLALGLAYRQEIATEVWGDNDVRAGALLIAEDLSFYDFVAPEEVAAGLALFPLEQLSLSADLVLARWGRYRTVHNEVPPEPLSDLWQVRAGVEWTTPFEPLQARIGYGYEPSPIPPQEGETNLLGGSAHVLATGIGFDLRALDWAALRLDTHVRAQLLETQQDEKQLSTLPDVRPDEPGRQIDNLGYPGFTAGGSFWQVGLTATIFLGSKSNAEAPESKRAAEPEDKP